MKKQSEAKSLNGNLGVIIEAKEDQYEQRYNFKNDIVKHRKSTMTMSKKDDIRESSHVVFTKGNSKRNYSTMAGDFNLNEDMLDDEYKFILNIARKSADDLQRLTKDSLVTICEGLYIPTTGNKKDLVYRIHDKVSQIDKVIDKNTFTGSITVKPIIERYIAVMALHVIVAKSAIRKIASVPTDPETGRCNNDGTLACQKIIKNGFNNASDPVIDDIYSDLFINLMLAVRSDKLRIQNGFLDFAYYDKDEDGHEIYIGFIDDQEEAKKHFSYWYLVKKSIRQTLTDNRLTNAKLARHGEFAVGYREDGTEYNVFDTSAKYRILLSETANLQTIADRADVHSFVLHIREQLKTAKADLVVKVFCRLVDGLTQKEVADDLGVSVYKVNRAVALMRLIWDEWDGFKTEAHNSGSASDIITTYAGRNITNYNSCDAPAPEYQTPDWCQAMTLDERRSQLIRDCVTVWGNVKNDTTAQWITGEDRKPCGRIEARKSANIWKK